MTERNIFKKKKLAGMLLKIGVSCDQYLKIYINIIFNMRSILIFLGKYLGEY